MARSASPEVSCYTASVHLTLFCAFRFQIPGNEDHVMRKPVTSILLAVITIKAFGTAQIPDILIYKGDTLSLFDCPLNYFPDKGLTQPKRLFGGSGCFYTACYRNYVATWTIEDSRLYLLSIRNACYPTDMKYVNASYNQGADTIGTEYADLETLFPDRIVNGRVPADWVYAKLISPKGKILYYIHDGFMSIFEKEIEFTIENGILTQTQEFDNSKTRISKYTQDPELLKEFIKNNINYSNVSQQDKPVKVMIGIFSATEDGKIDNVRIIGRTNEVFDKEAERVVKSIPQWDVFYRHGELTRGAVWLIPVVFEWDKKK